jgi:hypothetical protein
MSRMSLARRLAVVAVVAAAVTTPAALAQAVTVVDTIPGQGWEVDPSTTAGGTLRLVEGPATPPAGRGSLELGVAAATDFALLTNTLGLVPRPFTDLTGSWSTFVPAGANPGSTAGSVRFPSFQDATTGTGFTTVSVEASRQGTVVADAWQTWAIDGSSIVWQTNTTDGFCLQATPCTLAAFAAQYPNGAWGTVQLGVGSGVAGPVLGYVDALSLSAGGESFAFDFEIPVDQRSTATIGAVVPTDTGGTVPVTLAASALAAGPVTFVLTVGGETQEVTVAPGETTVVDVAVPFGTTTVSVAAQDVVIATQDVTVTAATTTVPSPPAPPPGASPTPPPGASPTPGPTLPATGGRSSGIGGLGIGLVVAGAALLAAAGYLGRRRLRG